MEVGNQCHKGKTNRFSAASSGTIAPGSYASEVERKQNQRNKKKEKMKRPFIHIKTVSRREYNAKKQTNHFVVARALFGWHSVAYQWQFGRGFFLGDTKC